MISHVCRFSRVQVEGRVGFDGRASDRPSWRFAGVAPFCKLAAVTIVVLSVQKMHTPDEPAAEMEWFCSGNELALVGCPIPYVDLTHTFSLTELRGFSTIESLIRVVFVPKTVFSGPRSRMAVTSRHRW